MLGMQLEEEIANLWSATGFKMPQTGASRDFVDAARRRIKKPGNAPHSPVPVTLPHANVCGLSLGGLDLRCPAPDCGASSRQAAGARERSPPTRASPTS